MNLLSIFFSVLILIGLSSSIYCLIQTFKLKNWRYLLVAIVSNLFTIAANSFYLKSLPLQPPLPGTIFSSVVSSTVTILILLIFIVIIVGIYKLIMPKTKRMTQKILVIAIAVWLVSPLLIGIINVASTVWFVRNDIFEKSSARFVSTKEILIECSKTVVLFKVTQDANVKYLCLSAQWIFPKTDFFSKPPLISYQLYSADEILRFRKVNTEWAEPIPENKSQKKSDIKSGIDES